MNLKVDKCKIMHMIKIVVTIYMTMTIAITEGDLKVTVFA